jgi:hypothetical protein
MQIYSSISIGGKQTSCRSLTLDHEVFDDSVELRSFVSLSNRFLGEFLEVGGSFWDGSSEETDFNATGIDASDLHVEINLTKEEIFRTGRKKNLPTCQFLHQKSKQKVAENLLESR